MGKVPENIGGTGLGLTIPKRLVGDDEWADSWAKVGSIKGGVLENTFTRGEGGSPWIQQEY
ncbi:hypothetical protein BGS_0748 [Beggiatoa sp. SS]|nr:hypothetical protein BGS_0748 [Beggiatoa sp. SS]